MWNGADILSIITEYNIHTGTAFYVYDINMINEKIDHVLASFKEWGVLYSMKANPNSSILKKMLEKDIGIDAASCNEVFKARECGYSCDKIYYSAPGKSVDSLWKCHNQSIIIADSINEVKRLDKIAKQEGKQIKIGIRVNIPNADIIGNAFEVMCGIPSKFGVSPEDFSYLKEICSDGSIEIVGIHIYFGSQILDENVITKNMLKIARFVLEITHDFRLQFVNFGGGFGVPHKKIDVALNLQNIANNDELEEILTMIRRQGILCNLELGRYLVAESGVFCCSVEDIKDSYGKKYVILSSGINSFFRPVFTKEFHRISKCNIVGTKKERVTIVGNLCTPIDQYYEDYLIEKLEIGDWIWIQNAGAYGFSMSMLDFISHEKPLEIVI